MVTVCFWTLVGGSILALAHLLSLVSALGWPELCTAGVGEVRVQWRERGGALTLSPPKEARVSDEELEVDLFPVSS